MAILCCGVYVDTEAGLDPEMSVDGESVDWCCSNYSSNNG